MRSGRIGTAFDSSIGRYFAYHSLQIERVCSSQGFLLAPAFAPVTKFNATVDAVERFPDMVRQAFRVAVSGTPGPVHLQFRGNEGQVDAEEAEMEPLVEEQFARVPPFRPEPDMKSVLAALKVLQDAERPVIVAGGGVRASGAGREQQLT